MIEFYLNNLQMSKNKDLLILADLKISNVKFRAMSFYPVFIVILF